MRKRRWEVEATLRHYSTGGDETGELPTTVEFGGRASVASTREYQRSET